jgi:hypothetical protein
MFYGASENVFLDSPMKVAEEKTSPFVTALYNMTMDPKNKNVITFSEDGMSIEIKDVSTFCSKILPLYFRHNNLSSFVRQVRTKY